VDFILLDSAFKSDIYINKKKVLDFIKINKNAFLFFYLSGSLYNYKNLVKLIKYSNFNYYYNYYYLGVKIKTIKILKLLLYFIKKK
jgi:hypothetical protein